MLFFFHCGTTEPPTPNDECSYNGQVQLRNQFPYSENGVTGIAGLIEICVDRRYTRVCVNNSFASVDVEGLTAFTCTSLGFSENCK